MKNWKLFCLSISRIPKETESMFKVWLMRELWQSEKSQKKCMISKILIMFKKQELMKQIFSLSAVIRQW